MKIRTSFVTNSSSNSYIVAWNKKPSDLESLYEMTGFSENDTMNTEYRKDQILASTVLAFILENTAKKNEIKRARDKNMNYWNPQDSYIYNLSDEKRREYWRLESVLGEVYSKQEINKFLKKNKGKHIRVYNFSDSGNIECICHDGIPFKNVEHMVISNH